MTEQVPGGSDGPHPPFRRARQPDQKAWRQATILEAAAELVEEGPLHELSLNGIARRSGVSKPNLYRYFESREHVLLRLFVDDLRHFVAAIESELHPLRGAAGPDAVAAVLAAAYVARPRLCRFLGVLASVLEQNVSEQVITEVRRDVAELSRRAAHALNVAVPTLPQAECVWVSETVALLVAGLWPLAHPGAAAAHVLAEDEFRSLKPDIQTHLEKAVAVLLSGLDTRSRLDPP